MEKLIQDLYDFSEEGQLVDKDFLEYFIGYYSDLLNIRTYINDFHIRNFSSYVNKVQATYGIFSGNITLNIATSKKYIEKKIVQAKLLCSRLNFDIDQFDINLIRNICILINITHEIEHAYHLEFINLGALDFKTKLLKESYAFNNLNKNKDNYTLIGYFQMIKIYCNYLIDPSERMANIYAYLFIIDILNKIDADVSGVGSVFVYDLTNLLLNGTLKGNFKTVSSTCDFLYKIKRGEVWETSDFYSSDELELTKNVKRQYSLEERLILGLPCERSDLPGIVEFVTGTLGGSNRAIKLNL